MSPTPVTFVVARPSRAPTAGRPPTRRSPRATASTAPSIVRFDLNTSPAPPDLAAPDPRRRPVRAPAVRVPALRLPAARRRPPRTVRRHVRPSCSSAPAPTRSSTSSAKAFLRPADRAVVPTPTYAMYRVLTEQRGAEVVAVPRLGRDEGWALDLDAVRAAAAGAAVVWLCSPNNPTALPEPDGAIERLLDGPRRGCRPGRTPGARRGPRRGLRRVRRAVAPGAPHRRTRTSSSCERPARPTRSPGCGSGSRSPDPRRHRAAEPVPAARIGLDGLGDGRHRRPATTTRSSGPTSSACASSASASRPA